MLLKNYTLEIFNSKCQPGAMGVHCFAHFEQDVSAAIPYLNAVLGGFEYLNDPPTLTLRSRENDHGTWRQSGNQCLER